MHIPIVHKNDGSFHNFKNIYISGGITDGQLIQLGMPGNGLLQTE